MTQAIIYLDDELNKKIEIISNKFNISKHDAIIKILKEYKIKDEPTRKN
jgi:hypothetical protein